MLLTSGQHKLYFIGGEKVQCCQVYEYIPIFQCLETLWKDCQVTVSTNNAHSYAFAGHYCAHMWV